MGRLMKSVTETLEIRRVRQHSSVPCVHHWLLYWIGLNSNWFGRSLDLWQERNLLSEWTVRYLWNLRWRWIAHRHSWRMLYSTVRCTSRSDVHQYILVEASRDYVVTMDLMIGEPAWETRTRRSGWPSVRFCPLPISQLSYKPSTWYLEFMMGSLTQHKGQYITISRHDTDSSWQSALLMSLIGTMFGVRLSAFIAVLHL